VRLLRLEGEGLGGRAIDLHPEISVLTDLDVDLEERLLRACRALPAAEEPGCEGLIEAHGVLFDLGTESLALLGLDQPLDVLLGRDDGPDGPADDGPSSLEVLTAAVAELRVVRGELDRAQLEVLAQFESARADLDPFARTAYEQARSTADQEAGLTESEETLGQLEDPGPLEERLAEIERIDREMKEVDRESITAALEVALAAEEVDPEAVEAGRLAVELRQLDTELADLDSVLESQGRHPVELARRRDAVSVEVARLESEHAPREVDPEDRVALEAAHDEVVEAEAKLDGSLLGGRNAERRLEEAVEATEVILERIGLPTYSAFVMAVTVGSVDPGLESRLHEARKGLAASQAEYEAATELLEDDPARKMLGLRGEEITARAAELLSRDPGPDVVGALLTFKKRRDGVDRVDDLRHLMEREGVLAPGLDLEDAEVCDFAAAWIEDVATAAAEVDQRTLEGADLRGRLATIEEARAEAESKRAEAEGKRAEAEETVPPDELVAASERLELHEEAMARVAELTELLEEVNRRRHEIEARIEAQEAVAELARSGLATDRAEPDESEELDELDEVRTLLKGRLAVHRDRSFAGAVPIVIRNVFSGFGRDVVGDLLTELARDADGVQIIILDDDLPVVTWATSVGFQTAAVVSPE
jgi:hypothetical protein